jgi:hypothetical protein
MGILEVVGCRCCVVEVLHWELFPLYLYIIYCQVSLPF